MKTYLDDEDVSEGEKSCTCKVCCCEDEISPEDEKFAKLLKESLFTGKSLEKIIEDSKIHQCKYKPPENYFSFMKHKEEWRCIDCWKLVSEEIMKASIAFDANKLNTLKWQNPQIKREYYNRTVESYVEEIFNLKEQLSALNQTYNQLNQLYDKAINSFTKTETIYQERINELIDIEIAHKEMLFGKKEDKLTTFEAVQRIKPWKPY